jgi:trehalose 6-phosphate synthase
MNDFVVVANRLPVVRVVEEDGSVDWQRSPGGLVTGLEPVMRAESGAWVGWDGAPSESAAEVGEPFDSDGIAVVPVPLTARELEYYYEGFANGTLWPLYHDVVAPPEYHRHWWDAYRKVNQRFADAAAEQASDGATVWVHDYQLQLVPQMLRQARPDLRIGFFLHIPFPPTELFDRLPWRRQLLEGLLGADLVGFQRPGAAANFVRLCRSLLGARTHRHHVRAADGRTVRAGAYPISIDFDELDQLARAPETAANAERMRDELGNPDNVIIGVDRLDYTKGISTRIKAFDELLTEGKLSVDDTVFIQVATPSRERVEQYRLLRQEIETQVGHVNGSHSRIGRVPITYLHTSFGRKDLAAMFRAASVALVTPLRDGMNLMAKEFVACRYDNSGVLILSEFAGAADELRQSLLVNPYDMDALKRTILAAVQMPAAEQAKRMRMMRRRVSAFDVHAWAKAFLADLNVDPEIAARAAQLGRG